MMRPRWVEGAPNIKTKGGAASAQTQKHVLLRPERTKLSLPRLHKPTVIVPDQKKKKQKNRLVYTAPVLYLVVVC